MIPDPPPGPEFDEEQVVVPSSLGPTVDVGDPAQVHKQARKRASKKRDDAQFWQAVFSTREGRDAMWGLLELAGAFVNRTGATGLGTYDPTLTNFYNGQKAIGQHYFMMWLGFDKDGVLQMMSEHNFVSEQMDEVRKTMRRRAPKTPTGNP